MKQTAVEQLVQEINKLTGLTIEMNEPCIQQALEIEKKQMRYAYLTQFEMQCIDPNCDGINKKGCCIPSNKPILDSEGCLILKNK
jgi:hypothetical protein